MSAAVLASTDEWRRKTGPDVVLHRFDDRQCSPHWPMTVVVPRSD